MLIGKGRPDTLAAGCETRWHFCGEEMKENDPCTRVDWQAFITGILKCPCPV